MPRDTTEPNEIDTRRMKATALKSVSGILTLAAGLLAGQAPAQEASLLNTQQDKRSYAVGADLAKNLKRRDVQVETEPLLRGIRDVLSGGKLLMADDELTATLRDYQVELRKKQIQARGGITPIKEANEEKGEAFLAENKAKEGVVTLPSGLQYKILKAGSGRKPTVTDTVECNFRGLTIDGRQFTGTDRTGKPVTLELRGTIAGWREALQLMPVGSKWQLFIPSELAFGEAGIVNGRGRYTISPNETLIYELELVAIK